MAPDDNTGCKETSDVSQNPKPPIAGKHGPASVVQRLASILMLQPAPLPFPLQRHEISFANHSKVHLQLWQLVPPPPPPAGIANAGEVIETEPKNKATHKNCFFIVLASLGQKKKKSIPLQSEHQNRRGLLLRIVLITTATQAG